MDVWFKEAVALTCWAALARSAGMGSADAARPSGAPAAGMTLTGWASPPPMLPKALAVVQGVAAMLAVAATDSAAAESDGGTKPMLSPCAGGVAPGLGSVITLGSGVAWIGGCVAVGSVGCASIPAAAGGRVGGIPAAGIGRAPCSMGTAGGIPAAGAAGAGVT